MTTLQVTSYPSDEDRLVYGARSGKHVTLNGMLA
jgi:hypothetical protein